MQRDEASEVQIRAARPDQSTWLSANAGSGKTRVLTDRVARLLLDRVSPQNILCLTYTRAAASEMQNRLFRRLGKWAMLPDDQLRLELHALGLDGDIPSDELRKARRLFASAIETPGGLKIQTIHAFCASLLRRFPLEAKVTPHFTEMEERDAAQLRSEITEEIAEGTDRDLLYDVARHYGGASFEELTREIVHHRQHFTAPLTDDILTERFGPNALRTQEDLEHRVFLGSEQDILDRLVPALLSSGPQDIKAGEKLRSLTSLGLHALPKLEGIFLFGEGAKSAYQAKIDSFPTKKCREGLADILPDLNDWMQRVEEARDARLTIDAVTKTRALHAFSLGFLSAYEAAKGKRGLLDFDDLILKTRDLLTDPMVAAWVLFRVDGGIDHILVDEAQDTSPAQWTVIEKLAQEFTSGLGAKPDILRTIFVVGDKKQSIYSFQGADPREFDRMQSEFSARLEGSNTPLQTTELEYSFRSSQAILTLVDQTFSRSEQRSFSQDQSHKAFKADLPGRVDLWPVIPPPEKEEEPHWYEPVDIKAANDPSVVLARQVAGTIKQLIDDGHPIPAEPEDGGPYSYRKMRAGDFLILVQRRADLFYEIIRECKNLGLPVAGADRLKVTAELAVRDITSLLSFLATPEDSLSLATALKSPIFGWNEAELYGLAQGRAKKYLWAELRDRAAEFPQTFAILQDLRDRADFLRPYELIERILTRHDGRRKLLGRLGGEAEDGIDALLAQAMAYERKSVDSLTGFLVWLEADELEIKRQMDTVGDRIRVMTVHGAKGLEAPVVILPDTGKREIRLRDQIVLSDDMPIWRTASTLSPEAIVTATDAIKEAEREERDRLLYVAMTRAEKWLIIAAAGDLGSRGDTWYDKIRAGMEAAEAQKHRFDQGEGLRLDHGVWEHAKAEGHEQKAAEAVPLPEFYREPAPHPDSPSGTLRPSDLGLVKALPGEDGQDEEAAKRRGTHIHRLLEILPDHPKDAWSGIAKSIIGHEAQADDLLREVSAVLSAPDLSDLFSADALREVPVSASLEALQGRRLHGIIDLLHVREDHVLAVDFKSNAVVPQTVGDCPAGLLVQMGAYALALQDIYPDKRVDTALLWTKTAELMVLPHDLVSNAVNTTHIP